jgi:uncharacterized flavoprotein (TIGR03862 family)
VSTVKPVVIIGAGPAGLMAADIISAAGYPVELFDAMPSPARKLLRAGVGGLNLTHNEAAERFITRYDEAQPIVAGWLAEFGQESVRAFARDLGIETFVGSSGRVFPVQMKAAPLLRAWLRRLNERQVQLHVRHRWTGWGPEGELVFSTPQGRRDVARRDAAATLLALGGASWPRLGSDGSWAAWLRDRGVALSPFRPANGGFSTHWSTHMLAHAGSPLKGIALTHEGASKRGEFMITRYGVEGGAIYALSRSLRERIEMDGNAQLQIDLCPDRTEAALGALLSRPRGRDSLANHLRRQIGLSGAKATLLRELSTAEQRAETLHLAAAIKSLPLTLTGTRPLAEAISSAGGVALDEVDKRLMLRKLPGVFCAGEMLDWEAPTGGYLLTAVMASGYMAGHGMVDYLR